MSAEGHAASSRPGMRAGVSLALALLALGSSALLVPGVRSREVPRPNIVVIVTDDQAADTIPNVSRVMPYLQDRAIDPGDHWVVFSHAYVNTPICCPSRATMLSGRFAHHTGVQDNEDGARFEESSTLATWLREDGYHTGLVGKYLNGYPFGRPPYVPLGWDRWWARLHGPVSSLYEDYTLVEQGIPVHYGHAEDDYATDVLASKATRFIREAPIGQPFFLWFAPTAPHPPWIVAERHRGEPAGSLGRTSPSVGEPDVSDKPAWVQALGPLDAQDLERLRDQRRRADASLLAVDDAVRAIVDVLRARGELGQTVIVFTSDNGYAFGEHRWTKKSCPYDACLRVPFMVRMPGVAHRSEGAVVSAVDLAPTIVELAGAEPDVPFDGTSLVGLLETGSREGLPGSVFAEWVGGETIPGWWEVRTARFAYVELVTGERELYALRVDPHELVNVVDDPRFAGAVDRLAGTLEAFRSA